MIEDTEDSDIKSEMIREAARHQLLIQRIFGSGDGKELLEIWNKHYVLCDLYSESERATTYAIGQRDIILNISNELENRE